MGRVKVHIEIPEKDFNDFDHYSNLFCNLICDSQTKNGVNLI